MRCRLLWRKGRNSSFYISILLLVLGTAILAFGTAVFLLPFRLVSGGISSLAILAECLIPALSGEVWISIFTYGLFFLGWLVLGRSFAVKTLLSTILYPSLVSLFSLVGENKHIRSLFSYLLTKSEAPTLLLISLLSGLTVGIGCAIAYRSGGSTGGVDILSLIVCRLYPRLRHSVVVFLIDATVIVLGIFITKSVEMSLLGILSALVSSLVIDKISPQNREESKG